MDITGSWGWLLLGVQVAGILAAITVGILMYRTSITDAERRRAAGAVDLAPVDGGGMAKLLRAKTGDDDLSEADLTRLRLLAETLRARRPLVLLYGAFPLTQIWLPLTSSALWIKLVGIALAVVYLAGAIGVERNATIAKAFLQRHPASGDGDRDQDQAATGGSGPP